MQNVLGANECGLGETCLAALMLLEIAGEAVAEKEGVRNTDEFWKEKFKQ